MKNIFLWIALLATSISFAQFTVATSDGNPINDGDIFTYNTTTYPDNNLEFVVTNTASNPIDVVIEVVSINNTDGSGFEICFGLCYSGITPHTSYPPTDSPYHLEVGASSEPHGNHFLNNTTNGTNVLEYVLKFKQVDANGNETGTPLTITYRYDPNSAGINDVTNSINYQLYPSVIKNKKLYISSEEKLDVSIINIQGKTISKFYTQEGNNTFNLQNMNSGTYFIIVTDDNGREDFKKIIIQ